MNDPRAQQPSQMILTWVKTRPQHREFCALVFPNSVWVLQRPTVICNKSCETGNGFLIYSTAFAFSFRPHCQATDSLRAPGLGRGEGEGSGHSWNRLMCKTQGNLLFFLLLTLRRNATLITHTGIHFLLVVY